MKLPRWVSGIGAERKKGGAVVTYTVPAEKVEGWIKRAWRWITSD